MLQPSTGLRFSFPCFWTSSATSGQVGPKSSAVTFPVAAPLLSPIRLPDPKIETEESIMATINLRDFYPWYTHDEFADVPDVIAAELIADRRHNKTHERTVRRNKVHSINAEDGTEATASVVHSYDSPEAVFEMKERHCRLCRALNSLPEIQGRRVEAHYLLDKSRKEIAKAEGVSESAVNTAIEKGLAAMKKYLENYTGGGCLPPQNCPD